MVIKRAPVTTLFTPVANRSAATTGFHRASAWCDVGKFPERRPSPQRSSGFILFSLSGRFLDVNAIGDKEPLVVSEVAGSTDAGPYDMLGRTCYAAPTARF